jgi:hypothetical protein
MKTCTRCLESKEDSEYYVIKRPGGRNPTLYRHCKSCHSVVSKENKAYSKDWELKKKYNISLEQYKEQCAARENKCDICTLTVKTLHVDHNHTSLKVRGYLCGSCNRAIGLLQDKASNCFKAGHYLSEKGEG